MSDGIELRDLQQTSTGRPQMPPRHPDAAPGTLGKAYRLAEEKAKAAVHLQEGGMDVTGVWGCGAGVWQVTISLPLTEAR